MFIPFVPFRSTLLSFPSRFSLSVLAYSAFVFHTFVRRPRTKPLLRKTWATWCVAYVMGRAIRRITAASSVPSKRRLYFRTPQRVHWLLVVVRSCPFHTFWIQVSHRRKMKDSKRCVDLVYNATAAHRKHVADIFTNLRFVFSPGIKLASFG